MATYIVNFYKNEKSEEQGPEISVTWQTEDILEIVRDCEKIIVWKNYYRAVVNSSVCPKYVLKIISNYYYRQEPRPDDSIESQFL